MLLGVVAVVVIVLIVTLGRDVHRHIVDLEQWIESLGVWGPVVFTAMFIALTMVFMPDSLLAILAGMAFGLPVGVATVLIGGVVACSLQYLLARNVLRGRVQRLIDGKSRLAALERAVRRQEVRLQLLMRLTPMSPTLASYVLGACSVRFGGFVVALAGLFPSYIVQVYIGVAGTHVATMTGRSHADIVLHDVVMIGGLLTSLVVLVLITRMAVRALAQAETEAAHSEVMPDSSTG